MSNDNDDNFDRELEPLLARARWPEPSPQAAQRLREQWHTLTEERPRRAPWMARLAAAAVLVLAFGGTWYAFTRDGQDPTKIAQAPNIPLPPTIAAPPLTTPAFKPPPPPPIVAQAPTPRERLAVLTSLPVVDANATVRKAIDLAVDGDAAAARASLRSLPAGAVERELAMAFASSTEDARRQAAIRLLGELGGSSALPLLARVAKDPKFAADAMPGVARLGGADALVALARASQPVPRREAMSHLLTLDTQPAVSKFLAMVLNAATRDDALASLHDCTAPPVERLIAALDEPRVDNRFAAAKALGALCDRTEVGEALRRMVSTNRNRREALAALLSCPSREATTFINTARARASVDAEVRAVQTELQRMF